MTKHQYELEPKRGTQLNDNTGEKYAVDRDYEGREEYEMDIDRMVNEGLAGGHVSEQNGYIGDATTEYM